MKTRITGKIRTGKKTGKATNKAIKIKTIPSTKQRSKLK